MVLPLKKHLALVVLLFVNHIASFTVTAALIIWFETIFPQYGEAPSIWALVLPLRTAVLYTLHSILDQHFFSKERDLVTVCHKCQEIKPSPIFSLVVAVAFQTLFYEPRWICAVLGVSDQGPSCSLPQTIVLEIPLGFSMILLADYARNVHNVR